MFHIGDRVCYPMHGVAEIRAIEEQHLMGVKEDYYILFFPEGKMTAMVPVARAETVGLRPLASAEECECILLSLKEPAPDIDAPWNQRYRTNMDKLRRGTLTDLADVVKAMRQRMRTHSLSNGEQRLNNTAKSVLLAELSAVLGREKDELRSHLD
ncbi:MAG: CarD family transcriptional regulator [Clostridia bacterium]|nr:CarD family transcriptional regulator [Clostridia bacterium]